MQNYAVVNKENKRGFGIVISSLSLIIISAIITDTIINLEAISSSVPIYFGLDGSFANYVSSKNAILIFSLLGLIGFIIINVLALYPHKLKYKIQITELNKARQYSLASTFMKILGLEIVILSSYIQFNVTRAVISSETSIGATYLIFLGIILVTQGVYEVMRRKLK